MRITRKYYEIRKRYVRMSCGIAFNRKSTETARLYIHDHLINAIGSQKLSCLCLLDISAAFDTIDHNILIIRLSSWFYSAPFPIYTATLTRILVRYLYRTHPPKVTAVLLRENCSDWATIGAESMSTMRLAVMTQDRIVTDEQTDMRHHSPRALHIACIAR